MAHEVETMFFAGRETPWHGLGTQIEEAATSKEAIKYAGLDWKVNKVPIYLDGQQNIEGFNATVRETDQQVLGIVSDRYKVLQNHEAFDFTDSLISEGLLYETAGSLKNGRKIWMLAKLPEKYVIAEDKVESYIVLSTSHDGSSGIKVAITPIRVVCQNTLNLALNTAKRSWSTKHMGSLGEKLANARQTLQLADSYMKSLKDEGEKLSRISVPDEKVIKYLEMLIPIPEKATDLQKRNVITLRDDFLLRYHEAPDLKDLPKNGWRFINAASDFATHVKPVRSTASYQENMFSRTVNGNTIIDKAHFMVKSLV